MFWTEGLAGDGEGSREEGDPEEVSDLAVREGPPRGTEGSDEVGGRECKGSHRKLK